ncbi:MAG TPA: hypothetical protein VFQ61_20540 [Polyangiaceae bacterium]|nr:hypothetical protein [Polyangiaceae bacterium]
MTDAFIRYLSAKRTVDDRALNRVVLERFRSDLQKLRAPRILEIGAGTGTMVDRLWNWNVIASGEYTLLDQDESLLEEAKRRLMRLAAEKGGRSTLNPDGSLSVSAANVDLTIRTYAAELGSFLRQHSDTRYDVLIACAVLDLVDVPEALPKLWSKLRAKGLFWFSINFDGESIFLPEHPLDERVVGVYHASMNDRIRDGKPSGDSKTGRHLFTHLKACGAHVLVSGSSDWVVHSVGGEYEGDEQAFLRHIVEFFRAELSQHAEIDEKELENWVAMRNRQIDEGDLVYIAHQLDFVGSAPSL